MDPDTIFLFGTLAFLILLVVGAHARIDNRKSEIAGLRSRVADLESAYDEDEDDDIADDDTDIYDECEDCCCDCMAEDDVRAVFDEPHPVNLTVNGERLGEFETIGEAAHALAFHWAQNRENMPQVPVAEACTDEPPAVSLEPARGPFGCDCKPVSVIAVCGACNGQLDAYRLN